MAEAIVTDITSHVIRQLGSGAYKTVMFAIKDLNSDIKSLQQLKTTVEAAILDARSLESCTNNTQKDALEKLECAFDDLVHFLDVKAIKANQKEIIMQGNKVIKAVRLFCSKSNQLVSAIRDADKVKAIMAQFESISQHQALVRPIISMPSVNKTQTMSAGSSLWSNCHILTEMVIGRDNDRKKILKMLLDDSLSSQTLSVASLVGIGGIGKTTLANYVYHDKEVKSRFDLCFWVSTNQDFDVHQILLEIFATFQDLMPANSFNINQMVDFFKGKFEGRKLLLVLDNVWDQEGLRLKWQRLSSLLQLGAKGSKVLVTTRNKKVAGIMDCVEPFVLGDLTKEDSWLLFQKIAFTPWQEPGVEAIGREIVKMCRNVPLVIRSIGGLLAGKCTVKEWLAFRDDQLANFSTYGSDIMQTLKLSYNQLDERLKLCIAYCSLFPKGYAFVKDEMIRLWISLGYIKPSYERQLLEDAAEECILMLTIQGFFFIKDARLNLLKMHDLMHDLMLSIVDFKYKMAEAGTCEIDERVRHLSLVREVLGTESMPCTILFSSILKLKQLQSLLVFYFWQFSSIRQSLDIFYYRFPMLRILRLPNVGIEKVPSSLGELITLRYIDLSGNPITRLPNSITQLVELLSLDVSGCKKLHEFPKGIRKLVKLRHLKNFGCHALIPKGVASLTDLQTLDWFPLEFCEGFPRETDCGLAELHSIINRVTGTISITVNGDAYSRCFKANEEHCESKGNLVWLFFNFNEGSTKGDEMVIECLQPNTYLREFSITGYKGERLPKWIKDGIHYFQNLVEIWLLNFEDCRSLGSFGRLLHLKILDCENLKKVEYIEENWCGGSSPYAPLFPSLEELWLRDMPKLKKWYNVSNESSSSSSNILLAPKLAFPKLQDLEVTQMEFFISMIREFRGFSSLVKIKINNCEDFKAIPDGIPNLSNFKKLHLHNCCLELKERCRKSIGEDWPEIKHIPNFRINGRNY